jgi:hypothetical protein
VEYELRVELSRALQEQPGGRALQKRAVAAAYTSLLSKYGSPAVRRKFALLAAPLMRRLLLSFAESGELRLPHGLDARELRQWLERLDAVDAHSGLMVDLHYFAGLGIRETALVLDVSRHTIVQDLRCARDWLFSYLGRRSGWGLARRLERD